MARRNPRMAFTLYTSLVFTIFWKMSVSHLVSISAHRDFNNFKGNRQLSLVADAYCPEDNATTCSNKPDLCPQECKDSNGQATVNLQCLKACLPWQKCFGNPFKNGCQDNARACQVLLQVNTGDEAKINAAKTACVEGQYSSDSCLQACLPGLKCVFDAISGSKLNIGCTEWVKACTPAVPVLAPCVACTSGVPADFSCLSACVPYIHCTGTGCANAKASPCQVLSALPISAHTTRLENARSACHVDPRGSSCVRTCIYGIKCVIDSFAGVAVGQQCTEWVSTCKGAFPTATTVKTTSATAATTTTVKTPSFWDFFYQLLDKLRHLHTWQLVLILASIILAIVVISIIFVFFSMKLFKIKRTAKTEGPTCRKKLRDVRNHWKSVWEDPWKGKEQDEDAADKDILLDECISRIGFGKFQIKLLFIVSMIWLADAMEMMMIAFISPAVACEFNLTDSAKALLTTVVFLGMFFGAFSWGIFDDRFGRKKGFFASVLWTFVFGIACPFAPTYEVLCVLRMLVGFGLAGSHVAITIFSEFLPSSKRSLFIIAIAAFWAVGCMLEAVLAWIVMPNVPETSTINGFEVKGLNWRVLVVLSSLPLAAILALYSYLPESPRFDLLHGNLESLHKTLEIAAKDNGRAVPKGNIVVVKHPKFSLLEQLKMLFASCKMIRLTLLTWAIWFAAAFTYYGIVLLNTELLLLEEEGAHCPGMYQETSPRGGPKRRGPNSTECVRLKAVDYEDAFFDSIAELPGVAITFFLLEIIGRKATMSSGFFCLGGCFFILFACMARVPQTALFFVGRAVISGAYQALYVFTVEVYPTAARAIGLGFSSSIARLGGMLTPFVSQVLIRVKPSPYLALGLYIFFSFVAGVASILLPIETKGTDLADVVTDEDVKTREGKASSAILFDERSGILKRD